ncbi:MAG: outer membrane protein assembly factor BamD [Planctomycetota bacterium]|nr:MAG: outer membrane protein assembly factor BamD [Planctomycetota bacterium]
MLLLGALVMARPALGQAEEFTLDESGEWVLERAPAEGSDEAVMNEIAALLASDQPAAARALADRWIRAHGDSDSPWRPRAFLLRGDALAAMGREFKALFDYEREVIQRFPQSEEYVLAIERELGIATRYARGLRRRWLGVRILGAGDIAEETLIRVQERLPGSELAERAAIELADFYLRRGDLELAAIAYDLYVANYPNGPNIRRAMEQRIRVNVARYKGPEYDGSTLIDAAEQARAFARAFPAAAERTALDDRLVQRIDDALADQMLAGARWYLKRGDRPSARFTLGRLIRKHPGSPAAQDARAIMVKRGWPVPEDEPGPGGGEP